MQPEESALCAVVQMCSRDDLQENLRRAGLLIAKSVSRGAKLVALPENLAWMGAESAKLETAEVFAEGVSEGPVLAWARRTAREFAVWLVLGGVAEKSEDPSKVYNTCVVLDAHGEIRAKYRKIHRFDVTLSDGTNLCESRTVLAGEDLVVVDTPVGKLGLSICYDVRFPELYRALVDRGAEVLVVPAAFTTFTGRDHWHVLLRARAIESQCHVLAPAQWGSHGGGRTTYGHALIADPWGTVLAECADGEGVAVAEINRVRRDEVRAQLPSLAHRRLR
ncbi:MAG: carbon-nitrogen hydrolase family protein [Deltaproteobacteria bacterium]|nr:carbon-nitrogen hydrolase family protein [Deltaproteobacteria bacterium]